MRSHRHILREIAHRNLDPKVTYVVGDNNLLVEKDKEKVEEENEKKLTDSSEIVESNLQSDLDNLKEEKPKKRAPPPRKKKESSSTE